MPSVYDSFPNADNDTERLDAPNFHRNIDAILSVLHKELSPDTQSIVEIGSGTGQHAVRIAGEFPNATMQPTDIRAEYRRSIAAWTRNSGLDNLLAPIAIDLIDPCDNPALEICPVEAILCFNVIHIAPTTAMSGLANFAASALKAGGKLILYGPLRIDGKHTAASNEAFDRSLRQRDDQWGVRDLETFDQLAQAQGLDRIALHAMPANNFMPVYRKN